MIGFTAQRLMELEVAGRTGAGHLAAQSCSGCNWRNGYREREWETRAGTVELRIPLEAAPGQLLPGVSRAAPGWPRRR